MSERAAYWQRLLNEWEQSGLSQAEFCRRRGIKAVNLAWWKRRWRGRPGRPRGGRYQRLFAVAATEPPRVRAILGALGEQLGRPARELDRLRASLNPSSRFDFGMFTDLPNARAWQAKERR